MKVKEIYKDELNFFKKEVSKIFLILSTVFLVLCISAIIIVVNNREIGIALFTYIQEVFEQLDISPQFGISMMLDLFLNNTKSGAMAILLGFVPFLFLPVFSIVMNGTVLGVVMGIYPLCGYSIAVALSGTIPHGIFELPAIIYAVSLGVYLNICIIRKIIKSKKKEINMKEVLMHITRSYFLIIVPMLAIAAVIEAFITPIILASVM